MLALPSEAGGLSERLLHQRRGVDEDFHLHATRVGQRPGNALQPGLHDVMIVATLGVAGDDALRGVIEQGKRIAVGPIVLAEHDDGAHVFPQRPRVDAAVRVRGHPVHVAVAPVRKEGAKAGARVLRQRVGRRDADGIEASGRGL